MDVQTRTASPLDLEALSAFFAANDVPEVTEHFHPFPLSAQSAREICLRAHEDVYAVAYHGSEIIGFFMLRGWEEGFAVPSFGVLVGRAWTGRGIGRRLLTEAVALARARGAGAIRLTVNRSNGPARRLYETFGFVERADQGDVTRAVMYLEVPGPR